MQTRQLGASGLYPTVVSLGSWLTYGASTENDAAFACMQAAMDAGINYFDTADVYNFGGAERVIGEFMTGFDRRKLIIGTKVFFPMSDDKLDRGLSQRHIFHSCQDSLERLQSDYIDLYQCHRYDVHTPLEETCFAMNQLINNGWVLHWGVSQWSGVQITNAVRLCQKHGWRPPVSNQPIYNMINRSLEVEVMEVCEAEKLGLIVYSPLAQGILTGKYTKGNLPEGSRAVTEGAKDYFAFKRLTDETFTQLEGLKKIAERLGVKLSQLALAWCLRKQPVTSVIIGASRPEQVKENVEAAGLHLDEGTQEEIETILANAPKDQYTGAKIGYGLPKQMY